MLANGGRRALGSGPLPRELLRNECGSGGGSESESGSEGGSRLRPKSCGAVISVDEITVISVDAAPYFLEDEGRYLFHSAYTVSGK